MTDSAVATTRGKRPRRVPAARRGKAPVPTQDCPEPAVPESLERARRIRLARRRAAKKRSAEAAAADAAPRVDPPGYVFVVTYGRSGSTLLSSILNSIDGYRIRGENRNALYGIYSAWRGLAASKRAFGRRALEAWEGIGEVRAEQFAERCVRAFVEEVLRPEPGDRAIGFKEIRYYWVRKDFPDFLDFMRRFFPGARFVLNVRDAEAVAQSAWWKKRPGARQRLAEFGAALEAFAAAHPEDCFLVRYDDYVGNPAALKDLFNWLGEPFSEATVAEVIAARKYS